jgi:hypothetical protein
MSYNYNKLRGRIVEKFRTQVEFAREMGISERTMSLKMTNKMPFKQLEISKAIELLEIDEGEVQSYFFTQDVQ